MAGQQFFSPINAPVDINGNVYPSSAMYFYEYGASSTPITVYSNAELQNDNTSLGQYIVANGAGEFPLCYFANGTTSYRMVFKRSVGGAIIKAYDVELPSSSLEAGSIVTSLLHDNAVTAPKIAADAVTNVKILDGTIEFAKLAFTIATSMIADGAVTAAKLASNAVTNVKILDGTIEFAKLAFTIGTTMIDNLAITAAKLATDAVETAKIKDANVTIAKLEATLKRRIPYAGNFSSSGALIGSYPSTDLTWSYAQTGTGLYTINHTIGDANYVCIPCCSDNAGALVTVRVATYTSTQVTLECYSIAAVPALTDSDISFTIVRQ